MKAIVGRGHIMQYCDFSGDFTGDEWPEIKPGKPSDTECMSFFCECGEIMEPMRMESLTVTLRITFAGHKCTEDSGQ